MKAAAAAAQAPITEAFDASRRRAAPSLSPPVGGPQRHRQVALARRESPARRQQHVGVALGLVRDLPQTLEALTHGRISESRATLIVPETATLTREDRLQVDAEMAPQLDGAGARRVADLARRSPTGSTPAQRSSQARRRRRTGA